MQCRPPSHLQHYYVHRLEVTTIHTQEEKQASQLKNKW